MSIHAVAKHVGLDWKTVKEIDKHFLEKEYGQTRYEGLRMLTTDEISIRRGHSYMTVVLNYQSGAIMWMGEGRSSETLDEFFRPMPEHIRKQIEAVAIDMWDPYIKGVHAWCPSAKIIFDLFHVVRAFGRVMDIVRIQETKKASKEKKGIYKGSKYLLLKNEGNLIESQRSRLKKLLSLNKTLSSVYILKDYLKKLWQYKNRTRAQKFLLMWCELAYETPAPALHKFAHMLIRYCGGILDHCLYPIHTSVLEGCNNKIKSIARRAFGFHDNRYFALKVIQAFSVNN
jgi:transposase